MRTSSDRSPAAKVVDEAIERAAGEGLPVVLVSADGSTRVLRPELAAS